MKDNQKVYGYVRVSSKDQNENSQLKSMCDFGIPKEGIFSDKQGGKDFNRSEYQTLKRMLKDISGSLLVIHSIDRLGRNYKEITNEFITEFTKWKNGEQTATQAMINSNTTRTTFYKLAKQMELKV